MLEINRKCWLCQFCRVIDWSLQLRMFIQLIILSTSDNISLHSVAPVATQLISRYACSISLNNKIIGSDEGVCMCVLWYYNKHKLSKLILILNYKDFRNFHKVTVWPSGLRRQIQALVRKGVDSNPTAVSISTFTNPF